MNNQAKEFNNLRGKQDFQNVSVSSAFEICKSYVQATDSIDDSVEVINFFFGTREFADRMLLGQALALLKDCLPRLRKLLVSLQAEEEDLTIQLTKMIATVEMLNATAQFFRDKFNWTEHHLTLRNFYLNILDILIEMFDFTRKKSSISGENCHKLFDSLMKKICELYQFILQKLTSPEISFFTEFSSQERDFLTEVLKKLFIIGEITPSINPMIYGLTWKSTHKLITSHSKELQKTTGDFLREPIKFLCKRIREGICETMHKGTPLDTQKTLKITKFHVDLLKRLIEVFQGDFLPHTEKILENLVFLQSVKFLGKSANADEIYKSITTEYMQNLGALQKNGQFVECLLNTNFSHDPELYAFLIITMDILKLSSSGIEKDFEGQGTMKANIIGKLFSTVPKCQGIFLKQPEVFEDLCSNLSLVIITENAQEEYKAAWLTFMRNTLGSPTVFSTMFMLQLWKNIQIASRENIRFEMFVMWKNILEKLPKTSSMQLLLIEKIVRISFDCLPKESQHRVVSLNNPVENHLLWSILGLNVISNPEKKKYLIQRLSEKVLKLISDFLSMTISVKFFEDMCLILKILGRSSFTPETNFIEKFIEMWRFIGKRTDCQVKQKKILAKVFIPLVWIFRSIYGSLSSENTIEIVRILRDIAKNDWPCEVQAEITKSLKIVSEKDSASYWPILKVFKKSSVILQLTSQLKQN
uniref:Uncharacterized protein n=2 Tax=Lutzomyia longipalpis TaxID=7200 RepID=A0A1B0EVR4_LUTLO